MTDDLIPFDAVSEQDFDDASALSAANFGGDIGDLLIRGAQSASFNFADNLADAVGLTSVGDVLRSGAYQAGENHPIISAGMDTGSGFLTGAGVLGKLAASSLVKLGAGRLASILSSPVGQAAIENAIFEAGLGADTGLGDAASKGAWGGITGSVAGKFGDMLANTLSGFSKPASQRILEREIAGANYDAADIARAREVLSQAEDVGVPITLAESFQFQPEAHIGIKDDPLTRKAKALYTSSPSGRRNAEQFFSERRSGSTERVTDALNEIYQTGTSNPILAKKIAEEAPGLKVVTLKGDVPVESSVSNLFETAYKEIPRISKEGESQIIELADSNQAFENALGKARRLYKKEDPFSLKVLHAAKKSMSQDIGAFKKGRNNSFLESEISVLTEQEKQLGEILRLESPTFDTAMTEFAKEAKFTSPRAELQDIVNTRTEDQDIIQALIGSPDKQEMIRDAIGDEGLNKVKMRLGLEKRALSGENLLRGNSTTTPQMLELMKVLGGGALGAVTSPIQTTLKGVGSLVSRVSPQTQEEMLSLLMATNKGGEKALSDILSKPERGQALQVLADLLSRSPRAF
jgi:exonuclease VII small subunit